MTDHDEKSNIDSGHRPDDESVTPADVPRSEPSSGEFPLQAPIGEEGSSLHDDAPTQAYDGSRPLVQDATVISQPPIAAPTTKMLTGPMHLGDIGKALVGHELGHFRLDEFVGGGGMGAVFRATDTQLERTVAVKVLTNRYGKQQDTVRRFRVEAQSAARLNHENIARVYFVGEDKGWNFIVFEFIEGENIRDIVIRDGPMDVSVSLNCAAQVAEALQHASDRSVVHRDIKPSNVLLSPDGCAKLVDMCLWRLRQVESSDDDLTVSGVTLGTFDYISPEQGRDPRAADVRSDIYSLGCTLYYMLTGEPPYPDRTVLQKLLSHTSDPPPDPRVLRPELPDEVADLTLRMLEKRPEDRYQQPADLIHDIILAGEHNGLRLGLSPIAISTSPTTPPGLIHHALPWIAPAVALLAIIFAADSMLKASHGDSSSLPQFEMPAITQQEPDDTKSNPRSIQPGTADNGAATKAGRSDEATIDWERPLAASHNDAFILGDSGAETSPLPSSPNAAVDPPAGEFPVPLFQNVPYVSDLATLIRNGDFSMEDVIARSLANPSRLADTASGEGLAISASVDIVVAQASELLELKKANSQSDSAGRQREIVTTLSEALALAEKNPNRKHIELRTNFIPLMDPIQLAIPELRITAAKGYSPVVRFSPEDQSNAVYENNRKGMIEIVAGSVRFEGIHFELDARSFSHSCSLFRLHRAEMLSLSDCWIRIIRNASEIVSYETALVALATQDETNQLGATIAVTNHESGSYFASTIAAEIPPPLELQWRNVVFSGEATVLSVPEARPLRFAWTNGFVATSHAFVDIGGIADLPADGELIELDLDQLTAVLDQGLCRSIASSQLPQLMTVDLHVTRSILITPEDQSLIASVGFAQVPKELESHLLFNGERNFYEGTEIFWDKMQSTRPGVTPVTATRLEFEEWQERWETEERRWHRNKVLWQTAADPNLPRHLTTPADYSLSDAPNNPARRAGGGVERSDAGCQMSQLPKMPAEMR